MKYANLDENNKILGWYADNIHGVWIDTTYNKNGTVKKDGYWDISAIPTPNIEAEDNVWQEALETGANFYNAETKTFENKDFRTEEEIQEALKQQEALQKAKLKQEALDTLTVVTSAGNTFDGNETARNNMLSAITSATFVGQTESSWKLSDNSVKVITLAEIIEALALAIQKVGEIVTDPKYN